MEAASALVTLTVFKTDVGRIPSQVGSIPICLRQYKGLPPGVGFFFLYLISDLLAPRHPVNLRYSYSSLNLSIPDKGPFKMLIPKKYHIHVVALLAVAVMLVYPSLSKKIDPQILTAGTEAAEDFLQLIDSEKYEQGWESSSALMREKIFLEVWNQQIPAMRNKVGALSNRKQDSSSLSDWAEGAPDGQYLTFKYASSFEKKAEAIETIILVLEEDGRWRVAGYFIK